MSDLLLLEGCTLKAKNYANEFILLRPVSATGVPLPVLGRRIFDEQFHFVDEVIATEVEICLKLNASFQTNSLAALQKVNSLPTPKAAARAARTYRVPIWFSEPDDDWNRICRLTRLSRDSYIEQLLACDLRVAMLGFLPGFVYLAGLPEHLHVPRQQSPKKRTGTNAFAIGGKYAGIYSLPSPAGWNTVGMLAVQLLQTDDLPPLELSPDDCITLQPVDFTEYEHLAKQRMTLSQYHG